MPALPNQRQERFVQALFRGISQQKAYVDAGFKPSLSNPSKLAKDPRIVARLAELNSARAKASDKAIEKAAEALAIDKQWVMAAMVENALIALGRQKVKLVKTRTNKQTGETVEVEIDVVMRDAAAANRSLELLGREFRMWIERKEIGDPGEFERMNERDLRDFLATEAAALRLGAGGIASAGGAIPSRGAGRLN